MPSTTPDLANDILSLNRTTERMILSSFQFTTRKNKKTVEIIDDVLGMKWSEKTHQVTTTVTPATDDDPSWAIVAVVLRRLLAQRYLFNENARRIAQGKPAQLRDIDQESAWKEDMWAKRGLTEFIDQVMNQQ